ncbi:MAG: FHA domain-containing protein [Anaerolineae bacterium]
MKEDKHIFISYNREDTALMHELRTEIMQVHRLPIWTDEGIAPDTPNWLHSIQRALTNAYCVVCILTPNTAKSSWVMEELFYARTKGISIYMVMVDGDLQSSLIFGFAACQITDLTDPELYTERLGILCQTIKSKHILKNENTIGFTQETLNRITQTFRDEEVKAKIEIPPQERHLIHVRKGASYALQSHYQIDENPCVLGRDESNCIIIRDTYISRKHCDFLYTAEGMWIRDLGSSNGTYVGGQLVEDPYLLSHGDRITFAPPDLKRSVELVYAFQAMPVQQSG